MTDELTKKLITIFPLLDISNNQVTPLSEDEAVAQIKQAFIDNGWLSPEQKKQLPEIREILNDLDLQQIEREEVVLKAETAWNEYYKDHMTGQEWHRRFVDELGKPTFMSDEDGRHAVYKQQWIDAAAKKAAGIDS